MDLRAERRLSYRCRVSHEARRKIAEGRQAEILEWEDGTVLKLFWGETVGLDFEATALSAIASTGLAPGLVGRVEVDGRPGLVLERVDGTDMLALLAKGPWRVVSLARALARSHVAINSVTAPTGLPELKTTLEARIREISLAEELRSFALAHVDALPVGDRLCHGDFHPGNVIVTRTGVSVIDWPNATRGHEVADHARTLLMLTAGDPPPATPPHIRALIFAGRRLFSSIYAGSYRRRIPIDRALLHHATIAHVAARIWEGIEVEIPKLTAFLERASRRSES